MSAPSLPLTRRALLAALAGITLTPFAPAALAEEVDPARIVSLGGAVTEILDLLGLDGQIAAIDTTSTYPPALLQTKPNVGYLRQLSAEGILSVRPTLVIASDGAGPPDVLKLVREAGIPVATVPDEPSPAGIRGKVEMIARLVGKPDAGAALAKSIDERFAALATARAALGHRDRVLFILSAQNGRMVVGGRNTSAAGILALAGAENAAEAVEGYKPMSEEAVMAAQPDAVLMMQNGPGGAANAAILDSAALAQTPAARTRRLVTMDGSYLLGFGPRTPDAARDLMNALQTAK